MQARRMVESDLEAVLAIENGSFHTPWSRESFEREIKENRLAQYYVLEVDQEVVAYCGMWIIIDEAHITNVAVMPNLRRRGYAKALIAYVLASLTEQTVSQVTLEVRVGNIEAIKLYESFGFKSVGIRPGYYQDTKEDASIMWITLEA